MIQQGEYTRGSRYEWILRMRTDVYYDFNWVSSPIPAQVRTVWSNYIGGCYTCAKHQRHCINDEWNILPRIALETFFVKFYEEYSARFPFQGSLSSCPECRLGWILWKNGFERQNVSVNIPIIRAGMQLPSRKYSLFPRLSLQRVVSGLGVF